MKLLKVLRCRIVHSELFCIFLGNFREFEKVKNVKKGFFNGPKRLKRGKKGLRKVQNYHKTVRIMSNEKSFLCGYI